ncbi:hypothetical protein [Qipengyuania atrilutea]|uniref:Uncharacterized protein n=1 Tax=Qipengyuania atrilutea TaxID=2744473 RepID=A0A850HBD0_9SPHN|nr:hypothetical protein [Actirhodobacter atriluteus]NVD44379.1 hypothetical protein [Actirhodobacter atriluteus]
MTRQKTRFVLALIAIVLGGLIVAALIFWPIPEGNREPLMLALGLVLAWGGTAYGFFFGSSEGSAQKTEMLNQRPQGTPADPVFVEEE